MHQETAERLQNHPQSCQVQNVASLLTEALRHTCATILLMAGKHPKYVEELLGHASMNITLDTCSHVTEGMDGGLADAIDDTL